ncbi:uncharacterized protein LOC127281173 [Leptopilina boulardi]|uniref:uncharacterized protein LOC127281173 n=1 Tax=Leptopilina boulardi TaxID=63433 RepID=UPI0021F646B3|nr:uncharacterized protein LOC127281173 [Leptopilina boulardi]
MEDTFFPSSPIAAVQFIPIINYLNILSDFLFMENYLDEVNQNKKIPIVNALYEYLTDNRDNVDQKEKLIRQLLKDSDMYGEKKSEEFEITFVNTMFDYIISSLVFEKYGNIYGFLAEAIRKEKIFKYNHTLMVIKETLKNAIFENEYGSNSKLTDLAVNRIYSDIILPLFPQPNTNLNLLSLDYIFAQAGSMYLRLGRINYPYYQDNSENSTFKKEINFQEYLTVGHVIKNLIHSEKIDSLNLRVFALPALFYYISSGENISKKKITNIIFQPHHWKMAYQNLFEYLRSNFYRINDQLRKDYKYNIHLAFSDFQSLTSMAQFLLNSECKFLNEDNLKFILSVYIDNAKSFKCQCGIDLRDIQDWFQNKIHNIGELYGKYELEIIQRVFSEFAIEDVSSTEITILYTNNEFNNSEYLFYDLFEFYFSNNQTYNYYALIRENNTVKLIKETDDGLLFRKKLHLSIYKLIQSGHRIILKYKNETINIFFEELMKHKKQRFKNYLRNNNAHSMNNEWWKEFGLSLMVSYPCLSNIDSQHIVEKKNLR